MHRLVEDIVVADMHIWYFSLGIEGLGRDLEEHQMDKSRYMIWSWSGLERLSLSWYAWRNRKWAGETSIGLGGAWLGFVE